ncbi:asparaginase [Cryomorphaceae bacterium]|nr:asparaginase [Cryomorphaceae bacterium]
MSEQPRILLIYTGGTIGMVQSPSSPALIPFDFGDLEATLPELAHIGCSLDFEVLQPIIDSSNMQPAYWARLAIEIYNRMDQYDGFVVLHGSDTMAYTASALSFMFEHLHKPIIFTGSQLPIGITRTDAKENLITSIEIASQKSLRGVPLVQEVCIYFEYHLYRGNRATKMSASHFEAFASPNYPALAEAGVDLHFEKSQMLKAPKLPLHLHTDLDTNVIGIKLFPGMQAKHLAHMLETPGLKCAVIETFGSGNAPTAEPFLETLREAQDRGLHLVNVTQCLRGRVQMGRYEASEFLMELGMVTGKDITFESAVTKAMFVLGQGWDGRSFRKRFEKNLRGELTD